MIKSIECEGDIMVKVYKNTQKMNSTQYSLLKQSIVLLLKYNRKQCIDSDISFDPSQYANEYNKKIIDQ